MKRMKFLAVPAGILGLVAVILWSGGFFISGRIAPQSGKDGAVQRPAPAHQGQAELVPVPEHHEAVGTVRPRVETRVEAQVTARVAAVNVRPGEPVHKGDLLVLLDGRELKTQLEQAQQALESSIAQREQAGRSIDAAQAAFDKAASQYRRIKALFEQKAIAADELDQSESGYLQAEAALQRAKQGLTGAEATVQQARKKVEQSEIALTYTEIRAHEDGEVAQRHVEPGDLAFPGKALLYLQTSGSLRLEALVREGLINRVRPGTELVVEIAALEQSVTGVVEEIVPSGDPRTRTFVVKVGLPPLSGAYPGMFGRLLVPLDARETVLVPLAAVRRTGQVETVEVLDTRLEPPVWRPVYVKTGRVLGDQVEILSGLGGGEAVALPEAPTVSAPTSGLGGRDAAA